MDNYQTATTSQLCQLTHTGSISSVVARPGKLFCSGSSFVDNSTYSVIDLTNPGSITTISSLSRFGAAFGLSYDQVSEFEWKGARDRLVHSWIIKPPRFDWNKKYPLAFLVHGGPQGAWTDSWSTRWNPAVFAAQGYVVVTPNPTGSTGYGQDFTDDIRGSWGGRPYEDLVKCFEYMEKNFHYMDTSRAVALGASYGGFMMNWIQGHDLGRKFKALVTHDGIFSTKFALATEELYFPIHDLMGTYWESKEIWKKWDPSEFVPEWRTPHLVIHNTLDYRLSLAEGLATFNALQLQGVESAFLTFPDENHWVTKPENSLLWHKTVINWINKYVGLSPLEEKKKETGVFAAEAWRGVASERLLKPGAAESS
jgi:dipeptidyl aminopeptidase/acylaminoacyl peptidase